MTRQLKIRRTLRTVLRGESLVNDATAFVAYRMAVKATTSGTFSAGSAAVQFAIAGAGGIAVGLAVGYAVVSLRRRLPHLAEAENTISLLTPFAAFIPAELLGLSSVLAVVAVGLYVGHQAPRFISPGTRVQVSDMWTLVAREQSALMGLSPEDFTEQRAAQVPLGRMERPEDVAKVIGFLASDRAGYMTGQAINVTGGLIMH